MAIGAARPIVAAVRRLRDAEDISVNVATGAFLDIEAGVDCVPVAAFNRIDSGAEASCGKTEKNVVKDHFICLCELCENR